MRRYALPRESCVTTDVTEGQRDRPQSRPAGRENQVEPQDARKSWREKNRPGSILELRPPLIPIFAAAREGGRRVARFAPSQCIGCRSSWLWLSESLPPLGSVACRGAARRGRGRVVVSGGCERQFSPSGWTGRALVDSRAPVEQRTQSEDGTECKQETIRDGSERRCQRTKVTLCQ